MSGQPHPHPDAQDGTAGAGARFSLRDWLDCSLFLDFDGTLVELAPAPEAVLVPPGLTDVLAVLGERLGGRLAIVSGRPIAEIDALLAPLLLPVAGVHGAERRSADGTLHYTPAPSLTAALACARRLAAAHPALRLEQKRGALALHYRQAPELAELCKAAMLAALQTCPGMELLHGKMVLEIKPAASDKGTALNDFMQEAPFMGHRPLFVGDDVTDEAGMAQARQIGGQGLKVGPGPSTARYRLASPQALRKELAHAAIAFLKGM